MSKTTRYQTELRPPYTFAAVGDIHGQFSDLAASFEKLEEAGYPRPEFCIAAGDVEAIRSPEELEGVHVPAKYRSVGEFGQVLEGEITIPPLYFCGGNHEPWPALDEAGAGHWGGPATFLGRAGVADIAGLGVAYLSGIYSPKVSEGEARNRRSPKQRTYWVRAEADRVLKAGRKRRVDVFVTHDWPAGVGQTSRGTPAGDPTISEIVTRIRPQVTVCGHMHHRLTATLEGNPVHCLDHIRGGVAAVGLYHFDGRDVIEIPIVEAEDQVQPGAGS